MNIFEKDGNAHKTNKMASKEGKAVAAAAVAAPDAALEDDEFEEFPKEGAYQSWTMPSQLGRERDAGKHRKNGC